MSEYLVIRAETNDTCSWIVTDETGAILQGAGHGRPADVSVSAAGRQAILLLPATAVLRVMADVPVKGGAKVLQALPFALEDQIAEDIDLMHFAAGARGEDGKLSVGVVRRDYLDGWLAQFKAAGIVFSRVYGESDAVGGVPNTSTLLLEDNRAVLAHPDGTAAAVDGDAAEILLDLWLGSPSLEAGLDQDKDQQPRHLVVYGEPRATARLGPLWTQIRPRLTSLDVHALPEGSLARLAAQIVTAPGLNLLQGSYAPRTGLSAYLPAWRLAALLLVGLFTAYVGAQALQLIRLNRESAALDKSIEQAFNYTFPGSGPVRDARAQFDERMKALEGGGRGRSRDFLEALNAVSQSFAATGAGRLDALSYRGNALEVRLRAPSVEALDKIQKAIAQNGLQAEIQSANAVGNEVQGRLEIKRKRS
jgi:general secretion pathway protein L